MDFVVAVMPRDIARQHAGVRRMRIAADHGQADAGQGMHAEAPEHADMAVSAADQHDVPQDGLIRRLHCGVSFMDGRRTVNDSGWLRKEKRGRHNHDRNRRPGRDLVGRLSAP